MVLEDLPMEEMVDLLYMFNPLVLKLQLTFNRLPMSMVVVEEEKKVPPVLQDQMALVMLILNIQQEQTAVDVLVVVEILRLIVLMTVDAHVVREDVEEENAVQSVVKQLLMPYQVLLVVKEETVE